MSEFSPVRKTIPRDRSNRGLPAPDPDVPRKPPLAYSRFGEEAVFVHNGQQTKLAEGTVEYKRVYNAGTFVPQGLAMPFSGPAIAKPEDSDYKNNRSRKKGPTNAIKGTLVIPLTPKPTREFKLYRYGE